MSRDTRDRQPDVAAPISLVIARVVQREFSRSRSARLRAERRRTVTQRARQFERLALAAVARS